MKRTFLSALLIPLLSPIWFIALATPGVAQEKSQLIVRPALVPDSLAGKLAARIIDTARVRRNWDKLRKGQTEGEVRKLLGLPAMVHIDGVNGWRIWWYGKRSVAFNSATKRASHWDEILDH
jgi:hypothetical protein